jgi:hypothetical protein
MKKSLYLLLLIIISSCIQQVKKSPILSDKKDTIRPDDKDSVVLDSSGGYKITKGNLREITKQHLELTADLTLKADVAYHQQHDINFNSEIGQDDYYRLYTYFLKSRNGDKKFEIERKTLTSIYNDINFIYRQLNSGGTYYSHMDARIFAYVEYAIYEGKDNDYYVKTYNITQQKNFYLNSIKQLIIDELQNNSDIAETEKPQLKKKLLETVNHMNGLITNTFYLKMAQHFQYSNY